MFDIWEKSLKKFKKRLLIGTLTLSFIFVGQPLPTYAGEHTNNFFIKYDGQIYKYQKRLVDIKIDGELLQTGDMPAILMNGKNDSQYTMVPVREVFEAEGIDAKVEWISSTKEVVISYQDKVVKLTIDSDLAYINDQEVVLDAPAKLVQDMSKQYPKTMLPLRFVSENLGFDVEWDADQYVANILTTQEEVDPNEGSENTDTDTDSDSNNSTIVDTDVTENLSQNTDDQLDSLTETTAKRNLPTALAGKSVVFRPLSTTSSSSGSTGSSGSALSSEVIQGQTIDTMNNITPQDLPATSIYQVAFETSTEGIRRFVLKANSGISKVDTSYWNGKLVVKVYNAALDVDSTEINFDNNDIVSKIEMGDHSAEDPSYSQINLVLKSTSFKFNLRVSEDRKYVYIEAIDASINQIELAQDAVGDYIDISGTASTDLQVFRLSNPTRLVFDIPNTKTLLASQSATAQGQYVNAIRTAQFTPTTTRVVVETEGQADYMVKAVGDQKIRIQLVEPGFENISYDHTTEIPTIIIDKEITEGTLDISKIQYIDDYMKREYTIIIPGDHASSFGSGYMNINDNVIDQIQISLVNNNTQVKIKAKTIHEFRIVEEDGNIVIKAYRPTDLYKKVIVVDAGHGGKDPGAVVGAFKEKDTNLGVVLELKKLLDQQKDIKVYYTRTTDVYPTLEERSVLANEVDADFFISLHCNSFTSNFFGTETLYLPGPNTSGLNSFELAQIIQDVFTENTKLENYKIKDRTGLYVLNKTTMPAVILEMGYLSNENDRKYLGDVNYYDDMGRAVYLAILEVFELYPTGR